MHGTQQTEDYSYFHLFLPHLSTTSTVFGISYVASTDFETSKILTTFKKLQNSCICLTWIGFTTFADVIDKLLVPTLLTAG